MNFARRLNGTGKVFATDTNDYCVDYMKKEADRRGLGNLHPVLVKKEGVDEFYREHEYDLITVFHLNMTYEDQVGYFRELRGFLAEGGRLVLILYKIPTAFSPGDFTGDFRGLARELSLEPADSPCPFVAAPGGAGTVAGAIGTGSGPERLRQSD